MTFRYIVCRKRRRARPYYAWGTRFTILCIGAQVHAALPPARGPQRTCRSHGVKRHSFHHGLLEPQLAYTPMRVHAARPTMDTATMPTGAKT